MLEIQLAPEIEVLESADSAGAYLTRGALLYSLPIPEKWTEDTKVHPGLRGKHSANPDFKCWDITPSGSFNYALCGGDAEFVSPAAPPVKLIHSAGIAESSQTDDRAARGTYPFDNPPFGIRVPVKEIRWTLEEGKYTPHIPKSPEVIDDTVRTVTLVPYGCTELRLTVFPTL